MYARSVLPSVAVGMSRRLLRAIERVPDPMAKRIKSKPQERGFVLFDIVYEDGSRASNRRVPMEILGGLDGDEPARQLIEEQDEAIAQKAGRERRSIQSMTRAPAKPRAQADLD